MPLNNRVLIAAAGAGKTTKIVREILQYSLEDVVIVTYTLNNIDEITEKFYEENGFIPKSISILPWFTFLLCHFVRPYQNLFYEGERISNVRFVNGQSAKYTSKKKSEYFLDDQNRIYSDKIAEFGYECNSSSKGLVISRLERLYSHIYIDEVQDLAGYDLSIIESLLKSKIKVTLVGDHRQATFQTHNPKKNSAYLGPKIINIFEIWERSKMCNITYLSHSHRCNQSICNFADQIYPQYPATTSKNTTVTGHDGIFIIPLSLVDEYVKLYKPKLLRYDRRTNCKDLQAMNFGDSKGKGFDRVLIFPNKPIASLLKTGNYGHIKGSASKFYVALTRARYSVAFVYDGLCGVDAKKIDQVSG